MKTIFLLIIISVSSQLVKAQHVIGDKQESGSRAFTMADRKLFHKDRLPETFLTTAVTPSKPKKNEIQFFKKIYVKLYSGYGFFTPGSYSVSSSTYISWTHPDGITHDTTVNTQAKKGIGGGFRYGLGFGLVQNDFLNIGLDIEFQKGIHLSNSINTFIDQENNSTAFDNMKYKAVTLTPHIIIKALAKPKYFIYNKLGLLITLPFNLYTWGNYSHNSISRFPHSFVSTQSGNYPDVTFSMTDQSSTTYNTKYKISMGIGLNVAFGINFRITDKLRAFGELAGNYSALSPASSLSENFYKQNFIVGIDSTNFHFEDPYRTINESKSFTTYKKGGAIAITSSQGEVTGPDSDGFTHHNGSSSGSSHKYTINMAVLGINLGIIYRF